MKLLCTPSRISLVIGTQTSPLASGRVSTHHFGSGRNKLTRVTTPAAQVIEPSTPGYGKRAIHASPWRDSDVAPRVNNELLGATSFNRNGARPSATASRSLTNARDLPPPQSIRSWSFEQFLFQSDVSNADKEGALLVDVVEHKEDYGLWLDLLQFRQRLHGSTGTWAIFEGIRWRKIDLPTDGAKAKQLWDVIILSALDLGRTGQILDYAQNLYERTGRRYEDLYEILVGTCFMRASRSLLELRRANASTAAAGPKNWFRSAYALHSKLLNMDLPPAGALHKLIPTAISSKLGLETFKKIYLNCNHRNLYDSFIGELLKRGMYRLSLQWHRIFMANGDIPKTVSLPSRLKRVPPYSAVRQVPQKSPGSKVALRPEMTLAPATEMSEDKVSGADRPEKVAVWDQLCARAFATKLFSLSFVIQSLSALGIKIVGPLTVQSLAMRCIDHVETYDTSESDKNVTLAAEVDLQLKNLERMGLELETCKFTELVQRLTSERNGEVLKTLITSDQHPVSYNDEILQRNLFELCIQSGNNAEAIKTLKVLISGFTRPMWSAWNALLRSCFRLPVEDRWMEISQVFDAMLAKKIPISRSTVRDSFFALLEPREVSKPPVAGNSPVDPLTFVSNMWLRIMKHQRFTIEPELWKEFHKRLGLQNRMNELERLILTAAASYHEKSTSFSSVPSSPGSLSSRALPSRRNFGRTRIDRLLPPVRQQAIILWYFNSLTNPELSGPLTSRGEGHELTKYAPKASSDTSSALPHVEKWARGVALLQRLKEYGLSVDSSTVRRACRMRLLQLYDPRKTNNRDNARTIEQSKPSLRYVVQYLQNLWQPVGALFAVPEKHLIHDSVEGTAYLKMMLKQPEWMTELYQKQDFAPQARAGGLARVPRQHSVLPVKLPPFEDRITGPVISMYYEDPSRSNARDFRFKTATVARSETRKLRGQLAKHHSVAALQAHSHRSKMK